MTERQRHLDRCRRTSSAASTSPRPRGDLEALRATLADDVEWTEMAGFPLAGTYRTPNGVTANVMEALGPDWDDWTAHDDTYVVDGENVVVLARYTAANKATGKTSTSASPTTSSSAAASSCASSSSSTPPRSATRCRHRPNAATRQVRRRLAA